jgi:hypothetical protein
MHKREVLFKPMDRTHVNKIYDGVFKQKEDSKEWAFTAADLRRAAEILFEAEHESRYPDGEPKNPEDEQMDGPATLLCGYAIENAIKGYLIKKHGGLKAAISASGTAWQKHRLGLLAKQTGIPLSRDLELVLGTMEAFVRWAGKYPISLKRDEFTIPKQSFSGDHMMPNALNYFTLPILDLFLKRLNDEILKEFNAKWTVV